MPPRVVEAPLLLPTSVAPTNALVLPLRTASMIAANRTLAVTEEAGAHQTATRIDTQTVVATRMRTGPATVRIEEAMMTVAMLQTALVVPLLLHQPAQLLLRPHAVENVPGLLPALRHSNKLLLLFSH